MMPVKDSKSGIIIGSFNKNHPKILSGEWVHHSKGKVSVKDSSGRKLYINVSEFDDAKHTKSSGHNTNGLDNPNSFNITNDEILKQYGEFYMKYSTTSFKHFVYYCNKVKQIKVPIIRANSKYRKPFTRKHLENT